MYSVMILNVTLNKVYAVPTVAETKGAATMAAIKRLKREGYLEQGMAWKLLGAEQA